MSLRSREAHPLEPFLPEGAKVLMLGSFPPPRSKWSMNFFYPNFINDMWRIMGLVFYDSKEYFVEGRSFNEQKIREFCLEKGIALGDTAKEVVRLKENASDKFLEVIEKLDLRETLTKLPRCRAIVTTGQKSAETLVEILNEDGENTLSAPPPVGGFILFSLNGIEYRFYRMPSSSRAYPLSPEKKAEFYRRLFTGTGIIEDISLF
jgi:G:T/U-mismatch repair DNA glycosylase